MSVWTNRLGRLEWELTRPSQAALWHFPNIPDPNQQEFLLYLHAWIKNHPDSLLGSQGGRDTRGCVGQRRNLCLELRAGSSWGFLHLHIIKTNSKARFGPWDLIPASISVPPRGSLPSPEQDQGIRAPSLAFKPTHGFSLHPLLRDPALPLQMKGVI